MPPPFDNHPPFIISLPRPKPKIMIRGSMSGNAGWGSLVFILKGQTITDKSYLDILKGKLRYNGDT